MNTTLRPAILLFIALSLVTGLIYPLIVLNLGKIFFAHQISGNSITRHGEIAGSRLIGQNFTHPGYFWGRLSATGEFPYNATASGGSNLGPLNPDLIRKVQQRLDLLKQYAHENSSLIPVDLVTASASGLDPDISIAAARYQANRIAQIRQIPVEKIFELIDSHIQGRQLGLFGEPRINVLSLNLALDKLVNQTTSSNTSFLVQK